MLKACGLNNVFQLGQKSNSKSSDEKKIVSTLTPIKIDISRISSLSSYGCQTVAISYEGKSFGAGYNTDGRITRSLPTTFLQEFTEFHFEDESRNENKVISAACGLLYTLYLLSPSKHAKKVKNRLAYASKQMKDFSPLILRTGDMNPIVLFSGFFYSVAINDDGSIIFVSPMVNDYLHKSSLVVSHLPDDDCAVCVSCCYDFIYIVGSSGRVYVSKPGNEWKLTFSVVKELEGVVIKAVYGTYLHCFALDENGRVFGRGKNCFGCLAMGEVNDVFDEFKLISSLSDYKIVYASAGLNHSLFKTNDGKLLVCGCNKYRQLSINKELMEEVLPLTEVEIEGEISFFIAGYNTTFICIGSELPQSPNKPIIGI